MNLSPNAEHGVWCSSQDVQDSSIGLALLNPGIRRTSAVGVPIALVFAKVHPRNQGTRSCSQGRRKECLGARQVTLPPGVAKPCIRVLLYVNFGKLASAMPAPLHYRGRRDIRGGPFPLS